MEAKNIGRVRPPARRRIATFLDVFSTLAETTRRAFLPRPNIGAPNEYFTRRLK